MKIVVQVRPVGVDLGIANIATTSSGYRAASRDLTRYRKRQFELRRKLQAKGTESAKRRLKKRRRKEQRHATNVNHIISKKIVTEAERTSHGIAVDQALFICRGCGVVVHADRNASHNIVRMGEAVGNAGRESRVLATP